MPNINPHTIDFSKLKHVEMGGVYDYDYPELVDAYMISASYKDKKLPPEIIEWINNNRPDIINHEAHMSLITE